MSGDSVSISAFDEQRAKSHSGHNKSTGKGMAGAMPSGFGHRVRLMARRQCAGGSLHIGGEGLDLDLAHPVSVVCWAP